MDEETKRNFVLALYNKIKTLSKENKALIFTQLENLSCYSDSSVSIEEDLHNH